MEEEKEMDAQREARSKEEERKKREEEAVVAWGQSSYDPFADSSSEEEEKEKGGHVISGEKSKEDQSRGGSESETYSLVSYNMLAQCLIKRSTFPYVCPRAMKWPNRKEWLLQELLRLNADVLCLQEVCIYTEISISIHVY